MASTFLGIRWAVDTNFFPTSRSAARAELWELRRAGYVKLERTDVLGTEILQASLDRRARLEGEVVQLGEYLGPFILGHSRVGSCVLGSAADASLLQEVLAVLYPRMSAATAAERDLRDAMHVAWAIRYGLDGLITEDRKLLRQNAKIRERFGFSILSPEQALVVAKRLKKRVEIRSGRGISGSPDLRGVSTT